MLFVTRILNFFRRRNIDVFWKNYLTRVPSLIHTQALESHRWRGAAPSLPAVSLFLCLTRRGSPHHPPPLRSPCLCQSSLSPLPFVRVILSPTMWCDAAREGTPRATRRRISVIAAMRRKGGKGHVGYLAVPYESVCASYVVRQSTRRLRRVRGGLNINGDAFVAATTISFRHTSGTGCGSRIGGFLRWGGPDQATGSIFIPGELIGATREKQNAHYQDNYGALVLSRS